MSKLYFNSPVKSRHSLNVYGSCQLVVPGSLMSFSVKPEVLFVCEEKRVAQHLMSISSDA